MNLLKNPEEVKRRWLECWAMENHERPLVCVSAPSEKIPRRYQLRQPETLEERWLDFDYIVKSARMGLENRYFAGESLPVFNPNLGPDIFGAILGCDISFGLQTSWCDHPVKDWQRFNPRYDRENPWLKKIIQLTEMAVAESRGDFLVGVTDIHPGMDGLVSLRGPQELCYDLYDCPEIIEDMTFRLFDVMTQFYNELQAITARNQEGTISWMHAWHPGRWYVTSCDFNCMVSNEDFRRFIRPELRKETNFFDANLFHLDGPGALTQLDDLLAEPGINGIQWVPGDGNPPVSAWPQVLQKCQAAGKMLHLSIRPDELPALAEILKPEGVMLMLGGAGTAEQADALVKQVEALWRKK